MKPVQVIVWKLIWGTFHHHKIGKSLLTKAQKATEITNKIKVFCKFQGFYQAL